MATWRVRSRLRDLGSSCMLVARYSSGYRAGAWLGFITVVHAFVVRVCACVPEHVQLLTPS